MRRAGRFDQRREGQPVELPAMLGIIAKVQTVSVNGKTWNRVMVGPYANASDTEAAQKTLADAGVKAIPMKQAAP